MDGSALCHMDVVEVVVETCKRGWTNRKFWEL